MGLSTAGMGAATALLALGAWSTTALLALGACATTEQKVWQNTPVIALLNGVYDGETTVEEIRRHGDQGVGTWDRLDGEGIILDGAFYQVRADGSVHEPPDDATMPFAQVTHFAPESRFELPKGTGLDTIGSFLDPQLPTLNTYFALRVEGSFSRVETRSLPAQSEPYPPFWKVQETEPKFTFEAPRGTMVGFRSPPYAQDFDPSNYHLHFLTEDRQGGGHVLSFVSDEAVVYVDRVDRLELLLPTDPEFEGADLDQIDAAPQ